MYYDIAIIGAGIIGMATAYQLSQSRPDLSVAVIEKEEEVAAHQTGNNSGVIHSGIYYKPGGSKAVNCQRGYRYLLDFAKRYAIPHDICGKVIVANKQDQLPQLNQILERGKANGMEGLRMISAEEVADHEPHVRCIKGIWVPQSGIISYRRVSQVMAEIAQPRFYFGVKVQQIHTHKDKMIVHTAEDEVHCGVLINCAGLYSDKIAQMTMPEIELQILPFRGEYYEFIPEKEHLVNNLIYPVPNPAFPFLGVHFTRMIGGGIEAGPNAVLAFKREGYSRWDIDKNELLETLRFPGFQRIALRYWREGLDELYRSYSRKAFVKALQELIPEIKEGDLKRGGAGVRAMACDRAGNLIDDYLFLEKERVINVCNAPSPAATSSLSIGQTIAQKVLKRFN